MKSVFLALGFLGAAYGAAAQDCWTNTAGHAFRAELGGMTDSHALFVMTDGTTNRLALAALDPASQQNARKVAGMPEIPQCMLPIFNLCRQHLLQIDNLYADERLDSQQRIEARKKILLGFVAMYRKHKLPSEKYPMLQHRLLSGK